MNRNILTTLAGGFLVLSAAFLGREFGVRSERASMEAAVTLAHALPNDTSETELMNSLLFAQYRSGDLTEDEVASMLTLSGGLKRLEVPFEIPAWGAVLLNAYDPGEDGDPKPNSPFGTFTCVAESSDGSFGCNISEVPDTKCVVTLYIEKGPVAGTYYFIKACDGTPVARRVKSPFDGYVVLYDTLIKE